MAAFGGSAAAGADDTQPTLEETYDYPDAAKILHDRKIRLIRGDGHIVLVDCAPGANVLRVQSRITKPNDDFCFQVKRAPGYVTLELEKAYYVRGDNHVVDATVTTDGHSETVPVRKNEWTEIGEITDPEGRPGTLVELRAKA